MKLSEFDYALPEGLIAQYPAERREKCRLMVIDRKSRSISHKTFEDITGYFKRGDLLVLNNTKVIPARLFGKRRTGGKVELFLLEKEGPTCEALARPSGRLKEGEKIILESGDEVEVLNRGEVGRFVRFGRALDDILMEVGHIPLPPYIKRGDEESDKHNYQTVYANKEGATASPTAGLHFTEALIEDIRGRGVRIEYVTLHTNYGTFAPITTEDVERHKMHKEYFELPGKTAEAVNETKKNGGRIFAVGTTTTRTLEHCASLDTQCEMRHAKGHTGFYIYPGYGFKVVDCMITNFHLPKSTLMLLVCAFAGKELIFEAYRKAIEDSYRFFSYGDAMLIL
ncbi:MAG: tRNA preQ1(34) S-adenosylmethionine ribosyltransferase-isomerase QueA [Candidatus Omnitrophota bacterium]|nr:tRNA preQ1(34) S-adenosylmethionine ribosyltransferase-isomerase QueA [Candidatus Omnitrophota bacterium]